MTLHELPGDQLVVVPLETMLRVAEYLAHRPYIEVAPLAAELQQLTTLREYQQARRNRPRPQPTKET